MHIAIAVVRISFCNYIIKSDVAFFDQNTCAYFSFYSKDLHQLQKKMITVNIGKLSLYDLLSKNISFKLKDKNG